MQNQTQCVVNCDMTRESCRLNFTPCTYLPHMQCHLKPERERELQHFPEMEMKIAFVIPR